MFGYLDSLLIHVYRCVHHRVFSIFISFSFFPYLSLLELFLSLSFSLSLSLTPYNSRCNGNYHLSPGCNGNCHFSRRCSRFNFECNWLQWLSFALAQSPPKPWQHIKMAHFFDQTNAVTRFIRMTNFFDKTTAVTRLIINVYPLKIKELFRILWCWG